MSIHDYLSDKQIEKIVSIIKAQCDDTARDEINRAIRIPMEIYDKIQKCRKAHEITGYIYAGFFYAENSIEGVEVDLVDNGNYAQPELITDNVIIHIYHKTNKLDSKLIEDRKTNTGKAFICIKYDVDKSYNLISVDAVSFEGGKKETENLFQTHTVTSAAV